MSQLEELFQEIREQVGADFIFTDIVDKNGISLANTPAAPEPEKVKTTSAPLPPPTWRGTDFSYKPEEVEPEIKKKPDSKKSGIDNTASSIQLARVMKLSAEFCKVC